MGLTPNASKGALTLHSSPEKAVEAADFVQESAPERLKIKQELYAKIDHAMPEYAAFSTSTSGLILSDLVANIETAHRFVVGHPFNPPYLILLVEVVAGQKTDPAVTEWAMGFYKHIGKHSILIKKKYAVI
jgi:carnitine 3-dehydrogenase